MKRHLSSRLYALFSAAAIALTSLTVPATAYATPTPDPSAAVAIAGWWTGGGVDRVTALMNDFQALTTAATAGDLPKIEAACTALGKDIDSAQKYAPIPDQKAEQEWAAALSEYALASTDCVKGAHDSDSALITKAAAEVNQGTSHLTNVTTRFKEIAG